MLNKIRTIQIQGKRYTVEGLMALCDEKIADPEIQTWERGIYSFLKEWFSSSGVITVTTSGSTGSPKKISLLKKHMTASAEATLSFFNLKKGDSAWLCLPVEYIAGKMMIVRAVVGSLNLLCSEPGAAPFPEKGQSMDFAAMVPNQVFGLLNSPKGVQQLSQIDKLLIGGSGITDELESRLLSVPAINAWHSYGMTETITHIALRKISPNDKTGGYRPLPGIKTNINTDNQLIVDAPALGITNLVTNDIADLLDDGSFLIVGRADNVIISGGVKLHPEIIEEKIRKLIPDSFFVGGMPDEKLGEKLVLFVESSSIDRYRSGFLKDELKKVLQKFEVPKEIVLLREFSRTETGKIRRKGIINQKNQINNVCHILSDTDLGN